MAARQRGLTLATPRRPMHRPRKRFGQHFLVDGGVIDAIVREISPQPGERVLEIGPGLGAMTQPLVERLGSLTVIELDRDLAARLGNRADLTVIQADALKVDFADVAGRLAALSGSGGATKLRVVGNLPYNISTPLLFHLLPFAAAIQDQHFMLQHEVVERMLAQPCTSAYGRLSVMLQWRYEMHGLLKIGPEAFDPPPRVQSALVRMAPRDQPVMIDPARLGEIARVAFSQRRKLLRHTLGRWLEQQAYQGSFDVQRRAEEVSVDEYIALAAAS